MDMVEFRTAAHEVVNWMADYLENVEEYPVLSRVNPGDIMDQLPDEPPENGEPFSSIFNDFRKIIIPGITHWQHPSFFAYFPANSSRISVIAEMLTATLATQCMIWQTSPAATELEEQVMVWLRRMLGLPDNFSGVIQDTASTATLCALLSAREWKSRFSINESGFRNDAVYTVYTSEEGHSSIEKAVKIAGFGRKNLRKIPVDEHNAMIGEKLEGAIREDIGQGFIPVCVIGTVGTTGSTAVDPVRKIGEICSRYNVWLHIDAAFAGTALVLKEMRWMTDGIELARSFVFNPHKWMFTNFDCSAYFVRNPDILKQTFEILPEYLKTREKSPVNNYRDWGIQLGRRFRALKLWFVIRNFGVSGIRTIIRHHIRMAQNLAESIENTPNFELLAPVPLNLVCFRYRPEGTDDDYTLDRINAELNERINKTGDIFLTHTRLNGVYALRMVIGQTGVTEKHVANAWNLIKKTAGQMEL